jgi:comEA protein
MERCKLQVWLSLFLLAICFAFAATSAAAKKPPPKPININTASSEELQQVPGIGPVTAEKILQMRKSYGAFKSVDDLLSIRGIGKKRLDKMRKYLTVSKSTSLNKPVTCPGCAKPGASQTKSPPAKNEPPPTPATDPEEPPAAPTGNPGSAAMLAAFRR